MTLVDMLKILNDPNLALPMYGDTGEEKHSQYTPPAVSKTNFSIISVNTLQV